MIANTFTICSELMDAYIQKLVLKAKRALPESKGVECSELKKRLSQRPAAVRWHLIAVSDSVYMAYLRQTKQYQKCKEVHQQTKLANRKAKGGLSIG